MVVVSASEARQSLPAQLDRVEAGDEVSITRHGRVVAVLVSPAALVTRRAREASVHADRIAALLERAAEQPVQPPGIAPARADELVADIQAARSTR